MSANPAATTLNACPLFSGLEASASTFTQGPVGLDRLWVRPGHLRARLVAPSGESACELAGPLRPLRSQVAAFARIGSEIEEFDPAVFEVLDEFFGSGRRAVPGNDRAAGTTALVRVVRIVPDEIPRRQQHVAKLRRLRCLMLDHLLIGKDGLDKLVDLEGLEELTLAQTLVQDDALPAVSRFSALRRLRLARTAVTGAGLAKLTSLKRLQDIDLSEATQLDDAALEHVGRLVTLERLNLWRVPVGDAGIAHLAGLVNLQWLNLDNTQLTNAGLVALIGMKKLAVLHLGSTAVSNSSIETLGSLGALREISLARTVVDTSGAAELGRRLPTAQVKLESADNE